MFSKILIANRGEIACRIIDSCRRLGVGTVAVYSDADRFARHVKMADEAVHIGASQATESYLQADRIVNAALKTGVDAIHPGFGFLSENPDFVAAVEAAGLTFIGPSAASMRAMGLKDAAKALMAASGVPVVPGYHGQEQDVAFLSNEAEKIGYPVLIKARAGGGGKGMRKVDHPSGFSEALESASREGQSSFGDGRVLIEKYINAPRHIEVQVFGDSFGNVVHLFERDCSLQRRHQKVIEEAPAPGMTDAMRAAMTQAAVKAAKAIDYEGAGTIEFIVDGTNLSPDGFWFMEMNTRLQVEHPVTEEITGTDLVEWQLRVASGEMLPACQDEISISGHAFEARIYAEDPHNDFLPATGLLEHLRFPDNARIETGVREEDTITAFYDPMIAKVITRGETRAQALAAMRVALRQTHVIGTVTNVEFLAALASHSGFARGDVDTGLIAREGEALTAGAQQTKAHKAIASLVAFGIFKIAHPYGAWQLWGSATRSVSVVGPDGPFVTSVSRLSGDKYAVTMDEATVEIERMDDGDLHSYWFEVDGHQQFVTLVFQSEGMVISIDGARISYLLPSADNGSGDAGPSSNQIIAPMPGNVTACSASVGQKVLKGDTLLVMEAMKMEHTLEAPMDGVVSELSVGVGEQVEKGMILVVLSEGA